ncbi:MAG TPA: C1 family peptidase [Bryobacteraceae bacterium]|nr:C1 family peptidase [Bryobacteraceae bacterium]
MRPEGNRGMGWIPDVPSFKDYTLETSSVQELVNKTRLASRPGLPGGPRTTVRSAGGGSGAASALAAAPGLATHVDLRPYCSPIEDQDGYNSCTANAAAGLVEYFEKRSFNKFIDASRMFVWKTTHDLMGITGNVGSYIRTTMEAMVLFGAPPEQYWAYDAKHFDVEPTAFCYAFGENYKTIQYLRLDPAPLTPAQVLDGVRLLLNYSFPSMFGFPVYDEFEYPSNGKIAYPSPNSRYYGSHAICAVGYDDDMVIGSDKGALLIRNSWGQGWGDAGYGWLSYKYVTQGLTADWWTLIKENWVDTGVF